ncbi:DUF6678 family protein [Psychromonas sp. KJ10-10]|uniref:DUF6678 family protein n=1 Tax=Psychromonas sp. KJ10-10 TaxID=3391823 RepID=UPI0039B414C5
MDLYKTRIKNLNVIINRDQLVGTMNTTKWNKPFYALNELDLYIGYRVKNIARQLKQAHNGCRCFC